MAKILVVEDETIVAMDIRNRLQSLGYEVITFVTNGEEAIAKAQENRPDLVVMDIMLEGEMDGLEAAYQIRARFDIPVVYLTAYSDESTLHKAKVTEPYGYILKPFAERELHTVIEMALHKHKIEKALKESRQWLATILESIGDAVIATDTKGMVKFMNPVGETLTGWKQEDVIDKSLQDIFFIIDEETRVPVKYPIDEICKQGESINFNMVLIKNEIEIDVESTATPMLGDKNEVTGAVVALRDVTDRKKVEKQLKISQQQLRDLSTYLQTIREQERTQIAREMHADLGLSLGVFKMELGWLRNKLSDQAEVLKKITSMEKLLQDTLQSVRKISTELRPIILDDLGLVAAIEWQVQEFKKQTGLEVQLVQKITDVSPEPHRATAIFRIFQESLKNVAEYANASLIEVSMELDGKILILQITDNGKGFKESPVSSTQTVGIIGVQERVHLLGGKVGIEKLENKTIITITIPIVN